MKTLFTLLSVIFIAAQVNAQNQEKVTFEQVKQQCASMPLEQRARVSVSRFSVGTTSVNDGATGKNANASNKLKALSILMGGGNAPKADAIPVTLGEGLSTELTAALQDISCFRVLETLGHNDDLTKEIDAGDSKYSSKKAPKAGKQLGPQITATGEVTEYSVKDKGLDVVGVGTSKKLVKIGFIIKLINTETRDIIFAKPIRVQSKTGSSVSVFGGLVSSKNSDPAIAAVIDDGILQAVQLLIHARDSLNITADNIPGNAVKDPGGAKEIEISLSNANFASYNNIATIIAALPGYKSMEKSFEAGVGTYTVVFTGSADDFATALGDKAGAKYELLGSTADKIQLTVK